MLAQQTGMMIWKTVIFKFMLIIKADTETCDSIKSSVVTCLCFSNWDEMVNYSEY